MLPFRWPCGVVTRVRPPDNDTAARAGEAVDVPRLRIHAFRLLAVIFTCAAAYHLLAIAGGGDTTRGRHAVFAGIDACLAVLILRRPPGFTIAFALLCGQQLVSHGGAFARSLREPHLDWMSLGVILVMPLVLALLVVDARRRRTGSV